MNRSTKQWLPIIAVTCSCLIGARALFALLRLDTSSNAVSIPILTTDYNSSTGTVPGHQNGSAYLYGILQHQHVDLVDARSDRHLFIRTQQWRSKPEQTSR